MLEALAAAQERKAALVAALNGVRRGRACWCTDSEIAAHYPAHGYWCAQARRLTASQPTPSAEAHEYDGAWRNVQHAATGACACNAVVNGRLCRLSRINPIHTAEAARDAASSLVRDCEDARADQGEGAGAS